MERKRKKMPKDCKWGSQILDSPFYWCELLNQVCRYVENCKYEPKKENKKC